MPMPAKPKARTRLARLPAAANDNAAQLSPANDNAVSLAALETDDAFVNAIAEWLADRMIKQYAETK